MSDIRSFFGSTKKASEPKIQESKKVEKPIVIDDEDDEFDDQPITKKAKVATPIKSPKKIPREVIEEKQQPEIRPSPAKKSKQTPIKEPIPSNNEKIVESPLIPNEGSCSNLKIAITGVLDTISREEFEDYVLQNGGKISGTVTGKTSFLVIGSILEDGRQVTEGSKYRTAQEKKISILTEEEFFQRYPAKPKQEPSKASMSSNVMMINRMNSLPRSSNSQAKSTSNNNSNPQDDMYSLWVDKYRPKVPTELIGHGEIVRKMSDWLKNWEKMHVTKTLKAPFNKENPGARAVLLSGPPGIGKTSMATIIARSLQYDVMELNASDTRNKSEIDEKLVEAVSTKAISHGGLNAPSRQRLIIMDEVDGMGGSDRGGIAELIKIIKVSKIPIICICNDRQSMKVKSLANHCYDLRVKRPTKTQIATRLVSIASQEGLQVDTNAAELLVEQSGNDIRQALNALQMWSCGNNLLGYSDMKSNLSRIEKDKVLRQSPFDACMQILSGSKAPWDERFNSFFIDYSLVPLLIQQNYIDSSKSGIFKDPQLGDLEKMEALSKAADAVSDVDLVGSMIRGQDQHWELLPTQAVFCLGVGQPIRGFQAFPSFPSWLGKYSATNKRIRLTKDIVHHTALAIGQGFLPIRLDYMNYLRKILLNPLLLKGKDGVPETISYLDHYGLTKDDFMETLREMQFTIDNDKVFKDQFETIDTQTKTAFTKQYNALGHVSQTNVQPIGPVKGGKGRKSAAYDDEDEEILDEENGEKEEGNNDDEEEEDLTELRKQLAKSAAKSTTKAPKTPKTPKTTTSSSSAGKGKK